MPQANIASNIVAGVPELEEVEKGDIVGAYTYKDGLLIYHFYKKDRKVIYDAAQDSLEKIPQMGDPKELKERHDEIALNANAALEKCPWWSDFEEKLAEVFSEVFKYQEFKAAYYQEVDSWSVILPAPSGLVKPNRQQLERPFVLLALRVGG